MIRYCIKRLLLMLPTFLLILVAAYWMTSGLVGSREDQMSPYGDGDALDAWYERVGAPNNRVTRFVRYTYDLLHGDMGTVAAGSHVRDEVMFRLGYTLKLAALGFAAAVGLGIPLGFAAAAGHNRWMDHSVSFLSALFASIPSYCLALFLVLLFCLWLDVLPIYGMDSWKSYVMPTMVLGAGGMSLCSRMTRSAVLEILSKPYLTVLRAKGLSESRILFTHVLKNALVPITAVAGNVAAAVLGSTLVVENFFTVPGLGSYLVNAVSERSQYRVLGSIVVLSLILILIGFLADVFSALSSPQFRRQLQRSKPAPRPGREVQT